MGVDTIIWGDTVRKRFKKSPLSVIKNIYSSVRKMALVIKKTGGKRFYLVGFDNLLLKSYCFSLGSVWIHRCN